MLAALPAFVSNHIDWFVSGLIVVLGLFVYGLRDAFRTRFGRIWAIGGVCFRDAIRRRVLWITPLAMLGILLVSQFQRPIDELDAVRMTTKVCLFTTGLVVVIIALVTAATNLPREIDNRVIFTIVTKPVTRLEIVIGKIVGFARVSAVMLLVMGGFSLAYLHTQAWWLGRQIDAALASAATEPTRRVWLEHYKEQGLLQSQSVTMPAAMGQYARPPLPSEAGGWLLGGTQDALIRFDLTPKDLVSAAAPDQPGGAAGIGLLLNIPYEPVRAATGAASAPAADAAAKPRVVVQVLDPAGGIFLSAEQIGKSASVELTDPEGKRPALVQIAPDKATEIAKLPSFSVQLLFQSGDHVFRVTTESVTVLVPDSETERHFVVSKHLPLARGNRSRGGQQLIGPTRGVQPVAVYTYRDAPAPKAVNGNVPFELSVGVETSGNDSDREVAGTIEVRAVDRQTGEVSPPTVVYPESGRTTFFELPEKFVNGGAFDLQVRNRTNGHTIGLTSASIAMVSDRGYFGVNLFKALFVLWMLAVLTAMVAFWCSTFLSWPIAVVLSTLIILGHWGVSNVDLSSGIGAQVANDFFSSNAPVAKVVNSSVETLSRTITLLASVLPDITAFGVADRLEKGTALSLADVAAPGKVLVVFGLPLLTLAYVFLRNKEVAP